MPIAAPRGVRAARSARGGPRLRIRASAASSEVEAGATSSDAASTSATLDLRYNVVAVDGLFEHAGKGSHRRATCDTVCSDARDRVLESQNIENEAMAQNAFSRVRVGWADVAGGGAGGGARHQPGAQ